MKITYEQAKAASVIPEESENCIVGGFFKI